MAIPKTEVSASGHKARDQKAKEIGLMVGIPGQLYFTSISRVSDVYVEYINGSWVSWRQRYYTNASQPSGIKINATGTFEHVLAKTEKFLKYVRKNRK